MRKIYTNTMMVLMLALTMMTFTSCDKDTMLAWDLDGLWSGTIIGDYYYDRYGLAGDIYDTEIYFYQNGDFSRGGTGYQVDRNRETRRYTRYNFDWKVRDQRIYIYYDDNYEVVIRDYEIYDIGRTTHFRGFLDDAYDGMQLASFDLVKVAENMRSVTEEEGAVEVPKEEFK
ncbi:MAG: hypothetical protein K6G46_05790 [Prevotella sp.]|jgi:hypothetical protein|nr:hypothetical protein [Prevotella sp.]